jgi:hypothetical protein
VAEDVLEALNCRDHELTPDHLVEIRKQSVLEKAEETEPQPQPTERTMPVLKLTLFFSGIIATQMSNFKTKCMLLKEVMNIRVIVQQISLNN